jgi:hypothetical protein
MDPEPEQQITDKMAYINVICQRINDVSIAISRGETGNEQVENLLTDIPEHWLEDIQPKIDIIKKLEKEGLKHSLDLCTPSQRHEEQMYHKRTASRQIKQLVVSMLDKKNLLFMSKSIAEESNSSFMEE